ncbi:homoserine kinase [Terrilactibacillus sp. S3-3]|nr:homoserine kinase [Terrilactibacillus sp. S3-3]
MKTPCSFQIRVPASTSNLGPGFDSIGLAMNRYLELNVSQADSWQFRYLDQPDFHPELEENLIYTTAKSIADARHMTLPAFSVDESDIPLARGLGSSGSAIIAGIEMADTILKLGLPIEEKSRLACMIEGHPDNVTASLYGGLAISYQSGASVETVRFPAPAFDFVTLIPNFELKTKEARGVLPVTLPFAKAIEGSSICNVLIAALLQGNGAMAGRMMEKDLFHQPYRAALIPDLQAIASIGRGAGAYGTFLSGAGPTVMCLSPKDKQKRGNQGTAAAIFSGLSMSHFKTCK